MKKYITLFVLLAITTSVLLGCSNEKTEVGVYKNVSFGMSRDDIREREGRNEFREGPEKTSLIYQTTIEDKIFDVAYVFNDKDELFNMLFIPTEEASTLAEYEVHYDAMRHAVEERFGKPTEVTNYGDCNSYEQFFYSSKWFLDEVDIEIVYSYMDSFIVVMKYSSNKYFDSKLGI